MLRIDEEVFLGDFSGTDCFAIWKLTGGLVNLEPRCESTPSPPWAGGEGGVREGVAVMGAGWVWPACTIVGVGMSAFWRIFGEGEGGRIPQRMNMLEADMPTTEACPPDDCQGRLAVRDALTGAGPGQQ